MSHPELTLFLSPKSEDDLTDILQYTLENWGNSQINVYREILNKALQTIKQNPNIVQSRKELPNGHRIFPAGQHLIIYRVTEDAYSASTYGYRPTHLARQAADCRMAPCCT
jgi:toxin ParE1/3/4